MKIDNSENPKVCVVMPVYNGAKTIELALKSLFYQTYANWNCVIVNDGSTDGTKEILDKIKDIRFKIIHLEKNRGRGYARQVCLDNATGDYLTYLDADDFYHSEKIKQQVDLLNEISDICLVSCGQGSFDNKKNLKTIRGIKNSGIQYFRLEDDFKFVPVTSMIRLKAAIDIHYNKNLNASEDVDFFSALLLNRKYLVHNQILYFYCEFESLTYSKIIEYNFNSIKRIIFNINTFRFIYFVSQLFYKTARLIFYIVAYPFLGKNFFLNRRGVKPTVNQTSVFNSTISKLNAIEI